MDDSTQDAPHEALFWEAAGEKRVKCVLCPRECTVADLERGTCGVRENRDGRYYTLVHSRPCSLNVDPIEKKPLFHFRPGIRAFSLATAGCNIECRFCQNWEISQFRPEQVRSITLSPAEVVRRAVDEAAGAIAFTYSEPVIFYEYMTDICVEATGTGVGRVMISNGYIQKAPLEKLLPHLDAVKIDFKSFREEFYSKTCSAHLRPVLDTLRRIRDAGKWLELVMLVIPTMNDSDDEFEAMSLWVVQQLGRDVPVHFTRFQPAYKMTNLAPTPIATLERARQIATLAGVRFAYAGNVAGHPGENTSCPGCGALIIRRLGYRIAAMNLKKGRCGVCGMPIPGVWN